MNTQKRNLIMALADLIDDCKSKMRRNPYTVPSFKQACIALGNATGQPTGGNSWMDVETDDARDFARREREGE